jgi:hypothetical protein
MKHIVADYILPKLLPVLFMSFAYCLYEVIFMFRGFFQYGLFIISNPYVYANIKFLNMFIVLSLSISLYFGLSANARLSRVMTLIFSILMFVFSSKLLITGRGLVPISTLELNLELDVDITWTAWDTFYHFLYSLPLWIIIFSAAFMLIVIFKGTSNTSKDYPVYDTQNLAFKRFYYGFLAATIIAMMGSLLSDISKLWMNS